jgi:AraC family transcriptional regulator, chitin signaling transcriptional activator
LKSRTILIATCIFASISAIAQMYPEKGMPPLKNYTPADYQNKGKVWDIASAPNGIVYMAADRGLLEFDGTTWRCFQGSDGYTRSLTVINDSLIYSGSDLDFGVWKRDKYGTFAYTSLYPFKKDIQDVNEEFWDVHHLNNEIFFVSARNIYILKNQQLIKINAPYRFFGSFLLNDTLYFADERNGLYLFDNHSLKLLFPFPDDKHLFINGLYRNGDALVVVTKESGLFLYHDARLTPLNTPLSEMLKKAKVFSFNQTDPSHVAFGTVMKGLFISDPDGNIIHQINKYKGLLSNTILSMHQSRAGKLWIGLDYGISSLHMNTRITHFYDYRGDFGTGYTALVSGGSFYLGTNQGLYITDWQNLSNREEFTGFRLIPGTEGQVWTIKEIHGDVFIGHDRGLILLNGQELKKMGDFAGVWTIQAYKDFLLAGTYNGIEIFRKGENGWSYVKKMDRIAGSCNQVLIEPDNTLWVNIPNYGVIRAELNGQLFPVKRMIFSGKDFAGHNPSLIRDQHGIHLITDQANYLFDTQKNRFIRSKKNTGNDKPEHLLSNVYQSLPLHPDYNFYPVYNGFALRFLHFTGTPKTGQYSLLFRKAEAYHSSGSISVYPDTKIPFRMNNVILEYTVPNRDNVFYQYKLDDSGRWSPWSRKSTAEMMNLREGTHTFFVRAMINGSIVCENQFTFRIAPPWHRTWIAWLAAGLLLLLLAYLIYAWQQIMLKKQKKSLLLKEQNSLRQQAQKHREKIMMLEQERLQTENELIKQQLKSKTIELASKSKDNEDKNRLLQTLKEKFDTLQKEPAISGFRLNEIRRILDAYLKEDDKTFEIQMDELHQELFRKLKEQFPALSGNDLRLCAYLKVGLNSKEIADILNIQPSSSYISRSRLRKKLNLKPDEDLYDFLNRI